MLFAWRFSRTFASRVSFANVVFFLPATVYLQVAQRTAPTGGALSTVLRSADARPHPKRLATSTRTLLGGTEARRRSEYRRRGKHRPCLVMIDRARGCRLRLEGAATPAAGGRGVAGETV